MWREERNKQSANSQPHQINRENIRSATTQEVLGEGIFGYCQKKLYRGHKVAVKYYKKSTINEVHNEAAHINDCDHPGLPYAFGVCTDKKPYILVMEYYGINGKSTTIAEALRTKLITDQIGWAKVLLYCSKAIAHIHSKGKVHCDLKGDNIVLHEVDGNILPVIIDFGKMRRKCDCKVKKLSLSDQEHYRKHHKHTAPEIVRGTHPPSEASDIYAFGLIVSLVCHYNNKFEDLRLIAVRCIHGTPEKRPDIDNIIDKLCCIVN